VGGNECFEAGVGLWVGDLPGEPAEDHAEEDDSDRPDVGLSRVVGFVAEDFGSEVGVTTDNTSSWRMSLSGVVKDGGGPKVD